MILGLGNDIIEVPRIRESIERHGQRFLDRIFTETEQEYCARYKESARHYAGRFAAKEAIVKALGVGISASISWLDIEILNDPQGKPVVHISPTAMQILNDPVLLVSISHCKEYASAVAIRVG
jgi:holo-[acyl-carrier protein] synthase